ncbi:MAG TPA: hypothetical protein VNH22_19140 [Blastocatellia bacterium]|nr:hypothetical protein [Blastocatellia bacterium]
MRRKIAMSAALAAVFAMSIVMASAKTDLTGTWVMDAARSEGLPPGMDQMMKIVQAEDKINIETKVVTDEGEQVVSDSYVLNGKEVEYKPTFGPPDMEKKGKRTARWTADGNGIEVVEVATLESPNGPVEVNMKRKWAISGDGKTIVIELDFNGPNGPVHTKRTFTKKA